MGNVLSDHVAFSLSSAFLGWGRDLEKSLMCSPLSQDRQTDRSWEWQTQRAAETQIQFLPLFEIENEVKDTPYRTPKETRFHFPVLL